MKLTDKIYIDYKNIKINIFSPITILILYLNETIESALLIFSAVLIHEFGHLFASSLLYVKIRYFVFEPFGCTLYIDEYTNYKKEILVALSGPIIGLLTSLLCLLLMKNLSSIYLFYFMILNLVYSLINLIPCSELDGGRIIEAYFYLRYDIYTAYKNTELINYISSVLLIALLLIICFKTGFNFSLTTLCFFIIIIFPNKKRKAKIQI